MQILNNIKFITGDPDEFDLQHRILNASIFGAAVLNAVVFIMNMILQLYWLVNLMDLIAFVLFSVLYIYSRITKKSKPVEIIAFGFVVLVLTPIMWFANGGSNSSFQYYIPLIIIGIHVAASRNVRRVLLPLLIIISVLLIVIEYFHPELVIGYDSRFDRYVDLMSGLFISLTGIYIFANIYFNQVVEANQKLLVKNERLKQIREELFAYQEKIKQQNIELEEKARSLQDLNKTKDLFLSIISHDLRSPFNSLLGLTEILILNKEKIKNPEMLKLIDAIHESAEHAYKLVLNLLEWSRLQSNRIEYSPVVLNLKKIIYTNIELTKIQARNKNINIIFEESRDSCYVNADENMVNTIIRNLLSNAIKYTRSGGKITIRCECEKDFCTVNITDTGIGISEKMLTQILESNTQMSSKGTSGEIGTGLGLVLCKEFARLNKGKISAVSEINKGSTFSLSLPAISYE